MSNSLSNLVDNLSEGLHDNRCTDWKSCLEYNFIENNQLIFNFPKCSKNYKKNILIKTYKHINFVIEALINLFY